MFKRIKRLILSSQKCTFYLAGPISALEKKDFVDWRNDMQAFLESIGHEAANPLSKYADPSDEKTKIVEMMEEKQDDVKIVREYMRHRIMKPDLEMVVKSDGIIAFVPFYSAGTGAEIALAYYLNKPVYVMTTMPREKWSGWLIGLSTLIFTNWEDLKAFMRKWRMKR